MIKMMLGFDWSAEQTQHAKATIDTQRSKTSTGNTLGREAKQQAGNGLM
jgi:hypothetical protein